MKATKLEVGKTYRWGGGNPFVAAQVMGPDSAGWWFALDARGGYLPFRGDDMPEEVEPPAPWIVRTEYRVPKVGEWYLGHSGPWLLGCYDDHPSTSRVVLIIEPNPEAQS